MFAPNSFINQPLPADVPIDPTSDAVVATLAAHSKPTSLNYQNWSCRLYIVGPNVPTQKVFFDKEEPEAAKVAMLEAVPIPPAFKAPGPWLAAGGTDGDHHVAIWQPSTNRYWDFWKMRHLPEDGPNTGLPNLSAEFKEQRGWHCKEAGFCENVSTNPGYFDTSSRAGVTESKAWGGSASGNFLGALLITADEARAGYIPHALRFQVTEGYERNSHRWPAHKHDSTDTTSDPAALQLGSCFTFPSSMTFTSIEDPVAKAIAVAIRDYGMYATEKGGNGAFKCQCESTREGSETYGKDGWKGPENKVGGAGAALRTEPSLFLAEIDWSKLRLVDSSYRPASIAPGMLGRG